MSKIESNSFVVDAKPFNLARTLVEVDDIVRFQAEQNGLRLYTDHDDVHDADLLGSALYLKKILVNLYSNAIKYNLSPREHHHPPAGGAGELPAQGPLPPCPRQLRYRPGGGAGG